MNCPEMRKPGGCQLHNLHCAAPECFKAPRKKAEPEPTAYGEPGALTPSAVKRLGRRFRLFGRIAEELDRAYAKHGAAQWGRHEFYGILKEEVDELWADIKADAPQEQLEKELVQVAAMCVRYFETRDRYREPAQ